MASLGIEIVGILNLSPDSFSDGHICETLSVSERLRILVEDGADRIDVGGESTAPGSSPIDERTELSRLQPFFQEARTCSIPFSVDTMKSRVALAGIEAGSDMINDVSGGRSDPRMLDLLSEHPSVRYVLMYSAHSGGRPDKKKPSRSEDILADVSRFFETRLHACALVGMRQEQIILDPGIGAFVSPDPEDSLRILRNIRTLKERFDQPIYVWTSRKGFLRAYTPDTGPEDRVGGSLATSVYAGLLGADFVRIHDVRTMRQFRDLWNALEKDD